MTENIEQKGIVFYYDYANLFPFSSSLFFRRDEKRGKNNQSCGQKTIPITEKISKFGHAIQNILRGPPIFSMNHQTYQTY